MCGLALPESVPMLQNTTNDGVARNKMALTILHNSSTRNMILDDIYEVAQHKIEAHLMFLFVKEDNYFFNFSLTEW